MDFLNGMLQASANLKDDADREQQRVDRQRLIFLCEDKR